MTKIKEISDDISKIIIQQDKENDITNSVTIKHELADQKPSLDQRISRLGRDKPFDFGTRVLKDDNEVWNHNAWDHVEWDEEQTVEAELKIQKQKENPVKDYYKKLYMNQPEKYWDLFYKNNKDNFFKDRKWLNIEFPLLFDLLKPKKEETNNDQQIILEIGCGAGNTLFPLLEQNENENLKIVGVDFSKEAIEVVKTDPKYKKYNQTNNTFAAVWDLSNPENSLPDTINPNSVDIIVMIFVFSALSPDQWDSAIKNLQKMLKPGGKILFRDYGRYDLTQLRFKKDRLLDENFYIRGDGTRVYFFTEEELRNIFCNNDHCKFIERKIGTDRRLLVNRKRKIKMFRIWLQGVFETPL